MPSTPDFFITAATQVTSALLAPASSLIVADLEGNGHVSSALRAFVHDLHLSAQQSDPIAVAVLTDAGLIAGVMLGYDGDSIILGPCVGMDGGTVRLDTIRAIGS